MLISFASVRQLYGGLTNIFEGYEIFLLGLTAHIQETYLGRPRFVIHLTREVINLYFNATNNLKFASTILR